MGKYDVKIKPFGSQALLIEWPALVSEQVLEDIQTFSLHLKAHSLFTDCEYIPSYNSLTLVFRQSISYSKIEKTIQAAYADKSTNLSISRKFRTWEIPVCYDTEFGIDLKDMQDKLRLSIEDIIKMHTSAQYTVYAIGFLPGFLYLGGLSPEIQVPRKTIPRLSIHKGDVGIAGQQTGVYPQDSPGGWNIIGNTPIDMFDAKTSPPTPVQAGDFIQFIPIDKEEHQHLSTLEHHSLSQYNSHL